MSDPKRLTDTGAESSDIERELCAAGQRVGMPLGERHRIWAALAQATLPIGAPSRATPEGGSAASSSASSVASSTGAKVLFGIGLMGALAAGTHWVFGPRFHAPVAVTAHAPPAASPEAVVAPSLSADAPVETDRPAAPSASVGKEEQAPSRASNSPPLRETQLREESLAVLEIRRVLRAGDAAQALALLEQARTRFAHPVLGQEREALTIEALARSGSADAARRRANTFLRIYPKSPYAADIRAFTSSSN